jgi:hypothetical protein
LQNGLYGLQFGEISSPGLIFHLLQLVVESKFLVAVVVRKPPAEVQCGGNPLK